MQKISFKSIFPGGAWASAASAAGHDNGIAIGRNEGKAEREHLRQESEQFRQEIERLRQENERLRKNV